MLIGVASLCLAMACKFSIGNIKYVKVQCVLLNMFLFQSEPNQGEFTSMKSLVFTFGGILFLR